MAILNAILIYTFISLSVTFAQEKSSLLDSLPLEVTALKPVKLKNGRLIDNVRVVPYLVNIEVQSPDNNMVYDYGYTLKRAERLNEADKQITSFSVTNEYLSENYRKDVLLLDHDFNADELQKSLKINSIRKFEPTDKSGRTIHFYKANVSFIKDKTILKMDIILEVKPFPSRFGKDVGDIKDPKKAFEQILANTFLPRLDSSSWEFSRTQTKALPDFNYILKHRNLVKLPSDQSKIWVSDLNRNNIQKRDGDNKFSAKNKNNETNR